MFLSYEQVRLGDTVSFGQERYYSVEQNFRNPGPAGEVREINNLHLSVRRHVHNGNTSN